MKNTILMLALFLGAKVIHAQTGIDIENFRGVDQQINAFLKTWNINGGSAAITKNGKLIYNRGFGFADQQRTEAAKPYHRYRIASVSKPITSIAIMKLVQEGKLKLQDEVFGKGKLLSAPYYLGVISDERIYRITVQDLLEHTAGWDRSVPYANYSHSDPAFYPLDVTKEMKEQGPVGDSTLIRFSLKHGLQFAPGTDYSYSNVGYLVLGKIIEKLSGMVYEDYVSQQLLTPLALSDIALGKNLKEDKLEREAEYSNEYTTRSCYGDGKRVPWQYGGFNLEAMNAHGGWIASAADLTKLMLAVDGADTYPDILEAEQLLQMSEPGSVNSNYARGWSVKGGNWWHTGSLDGSAAYVCKTNNGYTWAFLFNSRADNSGAFWKALDRLPWDCLKTLDGIPAIDLYAPDINASGVYASILSGQSAKLSWKNGSGNKRIVVASEHPIRADFPVDGSTYRANAAFGEGQELGKGVYVIYEGSGNSVTMEDLVPSKRYYVSVFEYYQNAATLDKPVYRLGDAGRTIVSTDPVYAQERPASPKILSARP